MLIFSVSKLKKKELQLLLNAAYQHMHKVPPDMRKALLIAAQDRMDKLNAAPETTPVPQDTKEEDDIVILQEVPCRESRTKVTIRDETGEVVTLLGRPAVSLPRLTSRYNQTWRQHFSGSARTRPIVKTSGLPTTLVPDMSAWRNKDRYTPSINHSCARIRPYHRGVGARSRIKRTGGVYGRFPVRQELSKLATRLRKVYNEGGRHKERELGNVFSLTEEGLDEVEQTVARIFRKERRVGRPMVTRQTKASIEFMPWLLYNYSYSFSAFGFKEVNPSFV